MIKCPRCDFENSLASERCSRCGNPLGFPNVNECSSKEESDALEKRYNDKVEIAKKKNQEDKILAFEESLKESKAVINVKLDFLHAFIIKDNPLYSTYQLGTRGEVRDFARSEFDKERMGVEGTLFGSYGENIRYAALSLDGSGLRSYGDFTLILADMAINNRTTLLEENSYNFIKTHHILAGDKIPPGYRALWNDRSKLAVAKLADKILLTKKDNYAKIVLRSTGNRKKDEYIEVHIYGKISRASIEAVRGNSKTVAEKDKIERIRKYLEKNKIEWVEE